VGGAGVGWGDVSAVSFCTMHFCIVYVSNSCFEENKKKLCNTKKKKNLLRASAAIRAKTKPNHDWLISHVCRITINMIKTDFYSHK
jgi:hypothetical protein